MSDQKTNIQIKGIRDGLLVTLGEGDWPEVQDGLLNHIDGQASFFQGARIALEVGNRIFHAAELGALRDKLSDRGVVLWAVLSNSPRTEQTAQTLGMATRIFTPKPERESRPVETNQDGEPAILVHRTLRSGVKVTFAGHVVVMGDVNPGAEVEASGNVMIWGRLRGVVHAGAEGNAKAVVCALDMSPTQLRIADVVATAPGRKNKPVPEVARVHNGQVIVEIWEAKKEGGK